MNFTRIRFSALAVVAAVRLVTAQYYDTVAEINEPSAPATVQDTVTSTGSFPAGKSLHRDVRDGDTARNRNILVVKETRDTVFIFDRSIFKQFARDWRSGCHTFRKRGYGASGGVCHGVNAIFILPIRDMVEKHPRYSSERYHFSRFGFAPCLMTGGRGYVGFGDGFRLGGGGMGGEFRSESRTSDTQLSTRIGYGGFLIEKTRVSGKWNLTAGGMLGGGSMSVSVFESDFIEINDWEFELERGEKAVFFLMEPHAGFSYSFLYFFHVGASISLPVFMSIDKFNAYADDFFSINPGFRITLMFGNLG